MTAIDSNTTTGTLSVKDVVEDIALLAKNIPNKIIFHADGSASVTLTVNGQKSFVTFYGYEDIDSLDSEFYEFNFGNSENKSVLTISTSDISLRDLADATDITKVIDALFSDDDFISGNRGDDNLMGYEGDDSIRGNGGDDFIDGWYDDDDIRGGAGKDTLYGGTGDDAVFGDAGNDFVSGGLGNDYVHGGTGRDIVQGNKGADSLVGGSGADKFVFKSLSDSTVKVSGRDTIEDFRPSSGDRIDLSLIDANRKVDGNQSFKFIGDDTFHKKAGELRFTQSDTKTFIHADANGDGKADFSVEIRGVIDLTKSDFIL